MAGALNRYGSDPRAAGVVRATRRRELLRIAMADLLGELDQASVGAYLSQLTSAVMEVGLAAARRQVEDPPVMSVIALGRWGGQEMSYASDADIQVVLADSDDPDAVRKGTQVLSLLRSLLKVPGPDPDLEIDVDLRPEGKDGPMVRSLSSTRAYYQKWSAPWEAQALIRARHGAGDESLSQAFLEMIEPVRYPAGGLTQAQLTEIRRLKVRMETERIGRGVDPRDHVKLGPGGLSDVEWTVQYLQLQQGATHPGLQVTGTLAALEQAESVSLIDPDDAGALRDAFRLASRIRNANTLLRNKASDLIPADATDLGRIAEMLGYSRAGGSHLADDWYRAARRSKAVTDRVFWGVGQ